MKEQLYTIPLNDAINADDECPFCFIERNVEQDLLDFTLGSGSSYMEADIREETDKAGFCRMHFHGILPPLSIAVYGLWVDAAERRRHTSRRRQTCFGSVHRGSFGKKNAP